MEKIFIETINGELDDFIRISLFMDNEGMKYVVEENLQKDFDPKEEHVLDIEVPPVCRREIMRRAIPNVDGRVGKMPKNAQISETLDDFIWECWEMITNEQMH